MEQLRVILYKNVPTIRISEAYPEPAMATDLLEHDMTKLNRLVQKGRLSYRKRRRHPRLTEVVIVMPIPEAQLETWSRQGAAVGSTTTYTSVKSALEDESANYTDHNFSVSCRAPMGTIPTFSQKVMSTSLSVTKAHIIVTSNSFRLKTKQLISLLTGVTHPTPMIRLKGMLKKPCGIHSVRT